MPMYIGPIWQCCRTYHINKYRIYRLLHNRPNKPSYDGTFAHEFLHGKQMILCEQIRARAVVVDSCSDPTLSV